MKYLTGIILVPLFVLGLVVATIGVALMWPWCTITDTAIYFDTH